MIYRLAHKEARLAALDAVKQAPDGWTVKVYEAKRNLEQNAIFHACCTQAARELIFQGKKRSAEEWKVLFCSGHSAATKQGHEIVPGLEGEWCNIRESTARMSKARMSSLIEYTIAYLTQQGINVPKTTTDYE